MTIFSECLKNIKDIYNVNTSDLAKFMERDVTTVHRWCNGSRTPSSFEPIAKIANHIRLTVSEQSLLEESYMKTVYGSEKYQHYMTVKNLMHFLHTECKTITHRQSEPILPTIDVKYGQVATEPYFLTMENHRDLVNEVSKLIHTASSEETINLKLSDPVIEIFHIIFYNLTLFGSRKMNIIFCMSDQELFSHDKGYEIFKNLCEMFLYNEDCSIYLTTKKTLSIENRRNCIFTQNRAIHFDHAIQKGTCTNYTEWIRDLETDYKQLIKKSRLIGNKKMSVVDQIEFYGKNDRSSVYEFMPCVSLAFNHELLNEFLFTDIPNREEFIESILNNYSMEHLGSMDLELICSEKGLRTFMETGELTMFPYPLYHPFSMEWRKKIIRKIIHFIESDDYSIKTYFHKNMEIGHVPCLEFQVNEYQEHKQMSNVNLTIILDDLTTHNVFFYSPALIQCCKDYLEVIHNPYYTYSHEETLERMKKILDEY